MAVLHLYSIRKGEKLSNVIALLIILFIAGGIPAVLEGVGVLGEVLVGFFPFFYDVGKMAIEEYLTSPYFIVGLIMSIGSALGIWFGAKGGKLLYIIVFAITEIVGLVSIFGNIL